MTKLTYQLLVFDWDGTLFDSTRVILDTMQAVAEAMGLPPLAEKTVRGVIGLGLSQMIEQILPQATKAQQIHFGKLYQTYIHEGKQGRSSLFAGVSDVMQILRDRGHWLAIATGKCRQELAQNLAQGEVTHHFLASRTPDETRPKPNPDMLLEIMDELGVWPSQTLMIGDTHYDMELALNAKTDALAVGYGVRDAAVLCAYPHVRGYLTDIRDLPIWLNKQIMSVP